MFLAALRSGFISCLSLLIAAPALATVVTLRDGLNSYSGTRDTRLASWETTNMGTNSYLRLETEPETSGLVKFAIFAREGGPVPDNATINSATLSLWKNAGEDAIFTASRVLKNWDEMQAHWLQAANGVPWTTNGARSAGNDFMATPDGQGSVTTGNAWININVTTGVQAFQNQSSPNYGWRLAFVSGTSPTIAKQFISRDNTQFPTNRPTLTIDYSTPPTECTPTASFTASPSSGVGPLAVTFDASTSSAPAGHDITNLNLQFGHNSQQVSWSDKNAPQQYTYPAGTATYTATLTVTNDCGTAQTTRQITVTEQSTGQPTPSPLPLSGVAIPTFHSMGLYYNPSGTPTGNQVFVRYRLATDDPANAASWKQAQAMWYDSRAVHNYSARGSVVHLQPGTQYVFEVGTGASYASATWSNAIQGAAGESMPSTWSETFPIGASGPVWSGEKTSTTSSNYKGNNSGSTRQHVLLADQSGTAGGYTLYDFTGLNASARAGNSSNVFPVVISGHHIIIRGLKTVGGESGIWIDPGSTDIVIEDCEITGYARNSGTALQSPLTGTQGVNEDAGIKVPHPNYGDGTTIRRLIIQRNKIHNPAFGSSGWYTSSTHPLGPAPIVLYPIGGEMVIRYNTTYATTDGTLDGSPHLGQFNQDGLVMGGDNERGIGSDVDIYKNLVMHYMDDGVETDGDGVNVRVWGNYFDYGGASAVSTAPTRVGPAYVWRNVYNRARQLVTQTWGQESDRLYMLKSGGMSGINGGRHYIFHNTSLQPPASSEPGASGNSLGAGFGAGGNGGGNEMVNSVSRNNVFQIWKSNWSAYSTLGTGNDFDYDLTNGSMGATEAHGITGTVPQYQSGNGWTTTLHSGKYRLQPGTPGHDDGQVIPNFNDGYVGAAPDRGAHEDGTPDMQFGTTASGS